MAGSDKACTEMGTMSFLDRKGLSGAACDSAEEPSAAPHGFKWWKGIEETNLANHVPGILP